MNQDYLIKEAVKKKLKELAGKAYEYGSKAAKKFKKGYKKHMTTGAEDKAVKKSTRDLKKKFEFVQGLNTRKIPISKAKKKSIEEGIQHSHFDLADNLYRLTQKQKKVGPRRTAAALLGGGALGAGTTVKVKRGE